MKKLIAMMGFLMGTTAVQAFDYPYLTVQKSDGTETQVSVESLVITFADGQLVAANADGTVKFGLGELNKMFFTLSTAGIQPVAKTLDGPVEVYNLSGMLIKRYETAAQATASLKRGVYVLKSGETTKKIAIK